MFVCQNCGECCGVIPVTKADLSLIKKHLAQKDKKEIERLSKQQREMLTCPLRDVENSKCCVYDARPEICRMQGMYEGLPCDYNPGEDKKSIEEGNARLNQSIIGPVIGLLGVDIGWKQLNMGVE